MADRVLIKFTECSNAPCKNRIRLRTPTNEPVEAFCSQACAKSAHPEWFKAAMVGTQSG